MDFIVLTKLLVIILKCAQLVLGNCDIIPNSAVICADKDYQPLDILQEPTYQPMEINFVKLKGNVKLIVPKKLKEKKTENAVFKRFYITESCVTDIERGYFSGIDNNNKALIDITFKNVPCLGKLTVDEFNGIGNFIKILTFDSMKDLSSIDDNFFESFIVLERLTLVDTAISVLSKDIITHMPMLSVLNLNDNKLTSLPWIPQGKNDLVENIQMYNNPFHCQCSLRPYVDRMRKVLSTKYYKCSSPPNMEGQALFDADMCGTKSKTNSTIKGEEVIATGNLRTPIIIAVSAVIVVILAIAIVMIIYKRCVIRKKKPKVTNHDKSPTKILFQNESEPMITS